MALGGGAHGGGSDICLAGAGAGDGQARVSGRSGGKGIKEEVVEGERRWRGDELCRLIRMVCVEFGNW